MEINKCTGHSFFDINTEYQFNREGYVIHYDKRLISAVSRASLVFENWETSYRSASFSSTFQVRTVEHRRSVHNALLDIFEEIIRSTLISYKVIVAGFAVKHPSGSASELGLHQDISMCDISCGRPPITAWIPLQNIPENGGRIAVVPKTVFFDRKPRAYGQQRYTELSFRDKNHVNCLDIRRGEMLLFDGALLHGSQGNSSDLVRVAVMIMLLPREKDVLYYRHSDGSHVSVPNDYYVENLLSVS